jgi:hypothetical protein
MAIIINSISIYITIIIIMAIIINTIIIIIIVIIMAIIINSIIIINIIIIIISISKYLSLELLFLAVDESRSG